jgi:chromosome segregation ATPase
LYDPNLPEESSTLKFVKQKLGEEAPPWIAMEALYRSLSNWRKQYSAEISKSIENIQNSLTFIGTLNNQNESLLAVLGDDFSRIVDYAKDAENVKIDIEKKRGTVINLTVLRDALQSSLAISKEVLSILYEELRSTEELIENLLPTKNYLWEKNFTLNERMTSAMEIIYNESTSGLKQVLENLPKALSYIDECAETIVIYNNRKEILLNYPIAEIVIEELLRKKNKVSAKDLPFEPKYSGEYLRLFSSQNKLKFAFDESKMLLVRRDQK